MNMDQPEPPPARGTQNPNHQDKWPEIRRSKPRFRQALSRSEKGQNKQNNTIDRSQPRPKNPYSSKSDHGSRNPTHTRSSPLLVSQETPQSISPTDSAYHRSKRRVSVVLIAAAGRTQQNQANQKW